MRRAPRIPARVLLPLVLTACTEPLPDSYPGTRVRLDPEAAATGDRLFFEAPYPSDLRLTEGGGPPLADLPGLGTKGLFFDVAQTAGDLRGYPVVPVAWFRLDGPVPALSEDDVVVPSEDAPLWLLDVDPDSPERGRGIPVIARALGEDGFVAPGVIAVAPVPGFVLRGGTTYAFVVTRAFEDGDGVALGAGPELLTALRGEAPDVPWGEALRDELAPLVETLDQVGWDVEQVAAAAVFTTADVVADLHAMSEGLRARHDPVIEDLALAPGRGADWPEYCELHGTISLPQFQAGEAPFNTEGLFEFGEDGLPVVQRTERIPVVVTVPRRPMPPGGYPLAMYFHGSGGVSDQLVIRGPRPEGGEVQEGYGPAWVLARQGIGGAGSAHPVNSERVPGASSFAYLNFANLRAFRDTFRQGAIEQRLYLDALLDLRIAPEVLDGCDGVSLPAGASAYLFDPEQVVAMGQSMGGMYTNLIGAIEPRIRAVVPTGAGGHWSRFILLTDLLGPGTARSILSGLVGTSAELSFMHPAMHVAQTAWEPAEPMIYTPRLALDRLPGHPVRPIYQPVGQGDSYFPTPVFDAMALAYGTERAGDEVWSTMDEVLALDARTPAASWPVTDNRQSLDGAPFTGVVVQYPGDGFSDPHVIFTQYDEVKHQYGCFFATFLQTGQAVVPAPGGLDDPCPMP